MSPCTQGHKHRSKPVETIARAAALDLRLFVALDALPPGPNLFPGNGEQFRLAPNGMVYQSSSPLPWFLENGGKAERDQRSHDHRG
jgi:hypothetical protein